MLKADERRVGSEQLVSQVLAAVVDEGGSKHLSHETILQATKNAILSKSFTILEQRLIDSDLIHSLDEEQAETLVDLLYRIAKKEEKQLDSLACEVFVGIFLKFCLSDNLEMQRFASGRLVKLMRISQVLVQEVLKWYFLRQNRIEKRKARSLVLILCKFAQSCSMGCELFLENVIWDHRSQCIELLHEICILDAQLNPHSSAFLKHLNSSALFKYLVQFSRFPFSDSFCNLKVDDELVLDLSRCHKIMSMIMQNNRESSCEADLCDLLRAAVTGVYFILWHTSFGSNNRHRRRFSVPSNHATNARLKNLEHSFRISSEDQDLSTALDKISNEWHWFVTDVEQLCSSSLELLELVYSKNPSLVCDFLRSEISKDCCLYRGFHEILGRFRLHPAIVFGPSSVVACEFSGKLLDSNVLRLHQASEKVFFLSLDAGASDLWKADSGLSYDVKNDSDAQELLEMEDRLHDLKMRNECLEIERQSLFSQIQALNELVSRQQQEILELKWTFSSSQRSRMPENPRKHERIFSGTDEIHEGSREREGS